MAKGHISKKFSKRGRVVNVKNGPRVSETMKAFKKPTACRELIDNKDLQGPQGDIFWLDEAGSIPDEAWDDLAKAGKILDAQDVPSGDRAMWDAEKEEFLYGS